MAEFSPNEMVTPEIPTHQIISEERLFQYQEQVESAVIILQDKLYV